MQKFCVIVNVSVGTFLYIKQNELNVHSASNQTTQLRKKRSSNSHYFVSTNSIVHVAGLRLSWN